MNAVLFGYGEIVLNHFVIFVSQPGS